jgi:hypothetical protein
MTVALRNISVEHRRSYIDDKWINRPPLLDWIEIGVAFQTNPHRQITPLDSKRWRRMTHDKMQ